MIDIALATALAGLGAFLFWIFWLAFYRPVAARKERRSPRYVKAGDGVVREKGVGARRCPVCGETLAPGAMVKSKLFAKRGTERIMHIYGCPYCWPENTEYRRVCPVCEKVLPQGGYLIARYFEKPGQRHVHVIGCSGCRVPIRR